MDIDVKKRTQSIVSFIFAIICLLLQFHGFPLLVRYLVSRYQIPHFFLLIVLHSIVSILFVIAFYKFGETDHFKWRFKWQYVALVLILFFVIMGLNLFVSLHLKVKSTNQILVHVVPPTKLDLVIVLISTCLIGPIYEEFLFRGVIMTTFFKDNRYYLDVIFSSLLFGYTHLRGIDWTWQALVRYGGMGLCFALVYRKTKSIYYSIALHMAWNIFVAVMRLMAMP